VIGYLQGRVLDKSPERLLVDVGGVGYEVFVPVSTFYEVERQGVEQGDPRPTVALHVHTHLREDGLTLYGFWTAREKRLFERLIAVSGIGPRLARVVLSGMPPGELVGAIAGGDAARLATIPGVGKKTAERLVLELKDKVQPEPADGEGAPPPEAEAGPGQDLVLALLHLGYTRQDAERGAERALREGASDRFEDLLRRALQLLSGGRR
jgi:Holliday junction DNA helicase RuvA